MHADSRSSNYYKHRILHMIDRLSAFWVNWKKGVSVLVRILILSFFINLILAPLLAVQSWPWLDFTLARVLVGLYVLIALPLLLPRILRLCGLQTVNVDEIDGSGDWNEAGKRKMLELETEKR